MNKTVIITIVVIVAILGFLKVTTGNKNGTDTASTPTLVSQKVSSELVSLTQGMNNLGEIPIMGGKVDTEFQFQNTGSEPVKVVFGETSCMCTEGVIKKENGEISARIKMQGHGSTGRMDTTIEPGEIATLVATFDPLAHGPGVTGPITRHLIIKTNSETTPEVSFSFQGNVVK